MRKPLQGVTNIVRFNWHFYVAAAIVTLLLLFLGLMWWPGLWGIAAMVGAGMVVVSTGLSLLASAYVYDSSDLYALSFSSVPGKPPNKAGVGAGHAGAVQIVNINAGFDETSPIIQKRYPGAELTVLDFYDPQRHTEVSIQRARRTYPPYPGTCTITTEQLPLPDRSVGRLFLTLAAHEIRDEAERIAFFRECRRVLAPDGEIYLTEHLRDRVNFLVYNIGFLHFHSRATWERTFAAAQLRVLREQRTTPFVTTFTLVSDGAAAT